MFLPFLVLALIFYFDFALGPYSIFRLHDTFDSGFFEYLIRGRLFKDSGLFSWDPHYAGGMPAFAGLFPPYYPLALLATVLPPWLIYVLMCLGFMTLAGYGMYRLMREFFQVPLPLAVFGAAVFALTVTTDVVHLVFNYAFPLFFMWFLDLYRPRLGLLPKALRLLGLLALSLSSYPVLTLPFFPVLHLALILLYSRPFPRTKSLALGTIMVWTGYVLINVPLIYSLYLYIPLAQRSYGCAYHGLMAALNSFAQAFKDIFFSQPTALLLLGSLPLLRTWGRWLPAMALVFISTAFSAFSYSQFNCLLTDTFLVKMDLAHFSFVIPMLSIIAAVLVLAEILAAPRSRLRLGLAGVICALLFLVVKPVLNLFVLAAGVGWLALMQASGPEGGGAGSRSLAARLALAAMAASLAAVGMYDKQALGNMLYNPPYARNYGNHPELQRLASERDSEVFRVGSVQVHPSVPQSYGLETLDQRGPLFNKYYKQLFKAVILPQLKNPEDEKWFDTYWYNLYLTPESPRPQAFPPGVRRSAADWNWPLLLMLNVKYLISDRPLEGMAAFAELAHHSPGQGQTPFFLKESKMNRSFAYPLWIYRLRDTFPRGYLAPKPVVLASRPEVLKQLAQQTPADLRQKVFFYGPDFPLAAEPHAPMAAGGSHSESLRLLNYSPDRLVFAGVAGSPTFLVISQNYDPGWSATINGRQVPVYRANHAFMAIFIQQAGPFGAVLKYHDPLVWWLHLASLAGLLLFGTVAFWGNQSSRLIDQHTGVNLVQEGADQTNTFQETLGQQSLRRDLWLTGLSGVAASLLFVGYFVYFGKLPAAGYNRWYFLTVVPGVGVFLSLWAGFMARRGWDQTVNNR